MITDKSMNRIIEAEFIAHANQTKEVLKILDIMSQRLTYCGHQLDAMSEKVQELEERLEDVESL